MFIDPMTLFIVGEIFVVYVIINIFLFYKSRLYNVLLALLKEMRFEKLRREQEKQAELARQRAGSIFENTQTPEAAEQEASFEQQLSHRIGEIKSQFPNSNDLTNALETSQSEHWLRVRLLELEVELLSGNIDDNTWQELATEAITRFVSGDDDYHKTIEDRKGNAEDSRYTGQLEADLQESENKLKAALMLVRQLETELEDIKSISTPTENHMEVPVRGRYEEEVYQLKCDNFDLQESINKLRLELQQIDPSIDSDSYASLLESQVTFMEQYIKSADISNGLLEKELVAAQKAIEELQKNNPSQPVAANTTLQTLGNNQAQQNDTLESIKLMAQRIRAGEDLEDVLTEHEANIAKLERIIKESQQCITILESELTQSNEDISDLEKQLAKSKSQKLSAKLDELSSAQSGQKNGIGNLQSIIEEIREGGSSEELLDRHSDEIQKLEGFLAESDTLISQLEAEIEDLHTQITKLEQASPAANDGTSNSKEDAKEMESLLRQYMSDTQSLLKSNNQLADENSDLKSSTTNTKSNPISKPDNTEPPIVTDVELIDEESKSE